MTPESRAEVQREVQADHAVMRSLCAVHHANACLKRVAPEIPDDPMKYWCTRLNQRIGATTGGAGDNASMLIGGW